jgi:Tfp pilus assembly protein FimT
MNWLLLESQGLNMPIWELIVMVVVCVLAALVIPVLVYFANRSDEREAEARLAQSAAAQVAVIRPIELRPTGPLTVTTPHRRRETVGAA